LPMYTVFSAGPLKTKQVLSFYEDVYDTYKGEIELTVQNSIAASSALISSSAMPVNADVFPCKVENSNVHNLSSQPSTPQQRSQQPNTAMGSTQSSPASAMLVIDRQPGSIQSHCSNEMRPCSTSSM
uniref:NTF2 domain-containing protein n=1 Tax=Brugia timori TaxID=42155 RepID=A0A0R3QIA0_9BILA